MTLLLHQICKQTVLRLGPLQIRAMTIGCSSCTNEALYETSQFIDSHFNKTETLYVYISYVALHRKRSSAYRLKLRQNCHVGQFKGSIRFSVSIVIIILPFTQLQWSFTPSIYNGCQNIRVATTSTWLRFFCAACRTFVQGGM